jgi:threonine dehydrogenase-like Zn-dependent dehydrogenase
MGAFVIDEEGNGQFVTDHPVPKLSSGEALVKVLRAGVCATDLELMSGYKGGYTGVLGHEFVGIVEEVLAECPTQKSAFIGKRVCGELNISCGKCDIVRRGGDIARNHCRNRSVLGIIAHDGTFAEYLKLPLVNLHVVPDAVSTEAATFVEPLAAAYRIVEQGLVKCSDRVCVVGDGKLGLLIAEVLARQPQKGKLTLLGRHPERAALLGDRVEGRQLPRGQVEAPSDLQEVFDVVVDVTGAPEGLQLATSLVMPMGKIVLKTTVANSSTLNTSSLVVKEVSLIGSRCGPFPDALRMLETCDLDVSKYVSAVFPLAKANEALAMAKAKGCLKVQIAVAESEMNAVGVRQQF